MPPRLEDRMGQERIRRARHAGPRGDSTGNSSADRHSKNPPHVFLAPIVRHGQPRNRLTAMTVEGRRRVPHAAVSVPEPSRLFGRELDKPEWRSGCDRVNRARISVCRPVECIIENAFASVPVAPHPGRRLKGPGDRSSNPSLAQSRRPGAPLAIQRQRQVLSCFQWAQGIRAGAARAAKRVRQAVVRQPRDYRGLSGLGRVLRTVCGHCCWRGGLPALCEPRLNGRPPCLPLPVVRTAGWPGFAVGVRLVRHAGAVLYCAVALGRRPR